MPPGDIGQQYDAIAAWWDAYHRVSDYGVAQVERALAFTNNGGGALDVGCGAGGRMVALMKAAGFTVTGIDASAEMVTLAQAKHPGDAFLQADIRQWDTDQRFEFILAWDCLFHLPLDAQKPVLRKLCGLLAEGGIMIHTFGNAVGEHTDTWREQEFAYSSIGITQNIEVLHESGLSLLHLELDQFPDRHVYAISKKA